MLEPVPLTEDVTLRPATVRDADALLAAYLRNRDHLRRWEPRRPGEFYTVAGQERRLKSLLAQQATGQAMPWLLAADDGDVVGRVTLNTIIRGPFLSADLSYWVDARRTGRGLTTAAVREVCRMADEDLRLHRIAAGTLLDNAASQGVLRKCGFEPIGTAPRYLEIDGRWQDHRLFQRILNDRPAT